MSEGVLHAANGNRDADDPVAELERHIRANADWLKDPENMRAYEEQQAALMNVEDLTLRRALDRASQYIKEHVPNADLPPDEWARRMLGGCLGNGVSAPEPTVPQTSLPAGSKQTSAND